MEDIEVGGLLSPTAPSESENTASNGSRLLPSIFVSRTSKYRISKTEISPTNVKMTSVDSGVETGNDSNDSAVSQLESCQSSRFPNELQLNESSPTTFFYSCATPAEYTGVTIDDHPCKSESAVEEIDQTWGSISSNAVAVAYSTSETQPGSSNFAGTSCGPLALFNSFKGLPTYQPIKCHPNIEDHDVCETPLSLKDRRRMRTARFGGFRRPENVKIKRFLTLNSERRLHLAAATNNVDRVKHLLESGVQPNGCDPQGRTPLHIASGRGYTEIVHLLLRHGANPSLQDCIGNTPLHLATVTSKISVVTLLLEAGTDPLSSDHSGFNPLQLAEAKLRLLQSCKSEEMIRMKSEVHEVVNMLVAYLKKRNGFGQQIEALSSICSRLTLSNTSNQVKDDVRDLLCNIDSLSLKS